VKLVLEGLIYELSSKLSEGYAISLGTFGTFRLTNGSKGVLTEEEFSSSLFNKARITFSPGTMLRDVVSDLKYEKMQVVTVTEACTKEHLV
jgi:predicted histone-like DNA-binding protein